MKQFIIISSLIISSLTSFSQSKKEQIVLLNGKVDSLGKVINYLTNKNSEAINGILKRESICLTNIKELNNLIEVRNYELDSIKKAYSLLLYDVNLLRTKNSNLDSINKSLLFKNNSTPQNEYDLIVEKWKTELYLNGEVGPPCYIKDGYIDWLKEYPNYYWGMQKISSLKYDFNSDNIEDALFYFPAVNCVGGNGSASDFAMLIYSNKSQVLTNKNISKNIEKKIQDALIEKGVYDSYGIEIKYKKFSKIITGNYLAWVGKDFHCCPSYNGSFEYNLTNFSIELKTKI